MSRFLFKQEFASICIAVCQYPQQRAITPLIYIVSDQTTTTHLKVASPHRTRGDGDSPFSSCSRPQLFKWWITVSKGYISIQCTTQLFSLIFIPWIVIYPVDGATTEAQGRVAKNILRLMELVTIISKQ